jgi:hypothetical protein
MMDFSGTDNSLQQLELAEKMVMYLLTNFLGVNVGKELVCKRGF